MNHLSSKVTDVITFPARTAVGAASLGLRTTVRVLGWAAEQALELAPGRTTPTVTVPDPRPAEPDVDPMAATRTPPPDAVPTVPARKTPAKKVPAAQVPLKSTPTPSLPAGVEELDAALDDVVPTAPAKKTPATNTAAKKAPAKKTTPAKKTAAKKTPAKKTPAKKAPARKAPSKQAAVLAPALGLSEAEVADVVEPASDADKA